jgi:hypothetical protein
MKASFAEVKLSRFFAFELLECELYPVEQGVFIHKAFAKCVSWEKSHQKFFFKFHINIATLRNSTLNGGKTLNIFSDIYKENLKNITFH